MKSLELKSHSTDTQEKKYFSIDTESKISELKKRRSQQLLEEMDKSSSDSPKIKIEFIENNSPSNSLRDVKMPVSILRKKSKYFVDNYQPKVNIPITKRAFE